MAWYGPDGRSSNIRSSVRVPFRLANPSDDVVWVAPRTRLPDVGGFKLSCGKRLRNANGGVGQHWAIWRDINDDEGVGKKFC